MCVCVYILQVEEENGFQDMFDMATSQDTLESEENGCCGDDGTKDDGEEDGSLGWTEEEKVFVQPALQLVKVCTYSTHTHTCACVRTHRQTLSLSSNPYF